MNKIKLEGKMKLKKDQNPFNVQVGQKWVSRDTRRKNKFTVTGIEQCINGIFAIVKYAGTHRAINLLRFGEYVKAK